MATMTNNPIWLDGLLRSIPQFLLFKMESYMVGVVQTMVMPFILLFYLLKLCKNKSWNTRKYKFFLKVMKKVEVSICLTSLINFKTKSDSLI